MAHTKGLRRKYAQRKAPLRQGQIEKFRRKTDQAHPLWDQPAQGLTHSGLNPLRD